jgi:hypothetical protein
MLDQTKWTLALTHFGGFVSGLPRLPDEHDILQFHSIIELFEKAGETDLSQFRIASDRINQATDSAGMTPRASWQARHPKKRSVDPQYFHGQVRKLMEHLKVTLGFLC